MTPAKAKKHLQVRIQVAQAIIDGLEGKPFAWGQGESMHYVPIALELGFVLATANKIKRAKHVFKRTAQPVGSVYFGAPIQKHCDVYLLGVHTKKKL